MDQRTTEEPTPLARVRDFFRTTLLLRDEEGFALDFIMATFLAAKAPRTTEPIFGALVGPPSSGKTLLLSPFMDWPGLSMPYSDQTTNALASGSPTIDRPLLAKLHRRTLVIKEMTAILSGNSVKRDTFFSTLRDAFDGEHVKHSGALSNPRRIKARFSVLAGVTDVIYRHIEEDVDLGQRFVFLRIFRDYDRRRRVAIARNILDKLLDDEESFKQQGKEIARSAIETIRRRYTITKPVYEVAQESGETPADLKSRELNYDEEAATGWHCVKLPSVTMTSQQKDTLVALAEVITRARSGRFNEQQVEISPEGSSRLLKQLHMLGRMRALADLRTSFNDSDMQFMRYVARDTITPLRLRLLTAMYGAGGSISPGSLAASTHLSQELVIQILTHYSEQRFVDADPSMGGLSYRLSADVREDLDLCGLIT